MKRDANRKGKGRTRAERLLLLRLACVYFNISSDRATQRTPLPKNHIKQRRRREREVSGTRRSERGTNDFSLSGNSAEDTFDLRFVIAFATGIPYSLRDEKWGRK